MVQRSNDVQWQASDPQAPFPTPGQHAQLSNSTMHASSFDFNTAQKATNQKQHLLQADAVGFAGCPPRQCHAMVLHALFDTRCREDACLGDIAHSMIR